MYILYNWILRLFGHVFPFRKLLFLAFSEFVNDFESKITYKGGGHTGENKVKLPEKLENWLNMVKR